MMEKTLKLLRYMRAQVISPRHLQEKFDACIAECEDAVTTEEMLTELMGLVTADSVCSVCQISVNACLESDCAKNLRAGLERKVKG